MALLALVSFFGRRRRGSGGGEHAEYRRFLEKAGLGSFVPALEALARPSIRLRSDAASDDDLTLGTTKLGGQPDLPLSAEWPLYDDVPQSFIAQVNLAEIHEFDREGLLPDAGLLSFFYDSEQGVWGFDPQQSGAAIVIFTSPDTALTRRAFPDDLPSHGRFSAARLLPSTEWTYVPWESSEVATVGMSRDQLWAYGELVPGESGTTHRLLGHPEPIQGDMQEEAQLVTHGVYVGDAKSHLDPRTADLLPGALDWRLLFQVDSDDLAEMMWGDVGRLYYWMHRDALKDRDWDAVHLILQCS